MTDIVERARVFAVAAHSAVGQTRKYTFEPYWVHPAEVVGILRDRGIVDEYMLAAAWLHDTVEDTGVEIVDIHREFGGIVASYVHWLTIPTTKEDGNRAQRKAKDRDYIRSAPREVKTIKLADLISNCSSIVAHDEKFAKTYLKEKSLMLEVLKEGDAELWEVAKSIVSK